MRTPSQKKSKYPFSTFVLLRLVAQKLKWSSHLMSQRASDYRNGKQLREILALKLKDIPPYSTLRAHWDAPYVLRLTERVCRRANQIIQEKKEHLRIAIDGSKFDLKLRVHRSFGRRGRTSKNK